MTLYGFLRSERPALILLVLSVLAGPFQAGAAEAQTILLEPDRVIDGVGGLDSDVVVVVEGDRISALLDRSAVAAKEWPADTQRYSLRGLTLLPGYIDTHVHIDWYFDRSGRTRSQESRDTEQQQMLFAAENAARTLRGGVTTVQSLGAEIDKDLRDFVARGDILGPRILTSMGAVSERTGDPAAIEARVDQLARAGADVIKIFGSASIRVGGTPTMTQAQLDAACGAAKRNRLRAVVHAHGVESARRSIEAGCTTIEHGALLDRPTLELMAERGVFYDPNIDLVLRNYFENKERFLGVGNYTEEGFRQMRDALPKMLETFKVALEVEGLDIVFGTDALAGSHGRNVQELVYRIETGGQDPMSAIVSATSLAARSLGLADEIGTVAPGYGADLIAVAGNPLEDAKAFERVRFVMKSGRVVRMEAPLDPSESLRP